jgi:hypothetical protein
MFPASINRPKSVKILNEELDAARAEADDERNAAMAIFQKAKSARRELTNTEAADFDRITNKRNGTVWLARKKVEQLNTELQKAQERERQLITMDQ